MKNLTQSLSAYRRASSLFVAVACMSALHAQDAKPKSEPAKVASGAYKILHTYTLGGEGSWDYLSIEPDSRHVFISRSSHVMVVGADDGKVVADIPGTDGVHGIAIAADVGRAYTSNGKAATSTVIDLKTLKPIGTVQTGQGPDAIVYDPAAHRVFSCNGRDASATAIDAATGTVAGTIALGGRPEFAAADGAGHLFINLEDKSEIVEVDSKALKVLAHWPIAPGEEPSGLAIDAKNQRLFSGCHNQKLMVVDATSGKVLTSLAIGQGVDANAFDPSNGNIYSSNGDGTLTVMHEDDASTFKVLENVTTLSGAKTMVLDPKTHAIYLGAAKYETPSSDQPTQGRPRRKMIDGSFMLLVVGR